MALLHESHCYTIKSRFHSATGNVVSLMDLGVTQGSKLSHSPVLSFVPEWRDPPNGCLPTDEPVGLSLM